RAGTAGEQAEAIHRRQLGAERVGDAVLEPADHPGAPAGEQDSGLPRVAQDLVEAVLAPDRERVRGVAAVDEDDVVRQRELPQLRRGPGEEAEMRRRAAAAQAVVPEDDLV